MNKKANTGADFENYVHFVYNTLLNLKGERIQVAKRTIFKLASGESYEIDIYYEFSHVGIRHRVAVECKDWKTPVDQGRVLEFHQKIKNIGEDIVGVFVSRAGYQSGAIQVAKRHGILPLTAEDIPTINKVLADHITTSFLPESHCIGEPFWYIAELSDNDLSEGTGSYYAFPEGSPVKIPLYISKQHALAYLQGIPDKEHFGVFGMPQYKLRGLLALSIQANPTFGIICGYPFPDGKIAALPIDAKTLRNDYLVIDFPNELES